MPELKPASREDRDEIDLLHFTERCIRLFKKYKLIITLSILGGIVTGIAISSILPKQYQSRIILRSNYLTNAEQIQIVESWNDLAKRHEYKTLSAIFHQPETVLKKLTSLEAGEVQKFFTPNNPNGFFIDAKVTDNAVLEKIQDGITHGLSNGSYIKKRVASRTENLQQLITEATIETAKLDSTKKNIEEMITQRNGNNFSVMVDISGINRQLIDMKEKLLDYKDQLKFMQGVLVLQDFTPLNTPVSLGWKTLGVLGLLFGIFISVVIVTIKEITHKLSKQA